MTLRTALLLLLLGLAQPVAAQEVRVLSGEHENFSRLVFMVPSRTDWELREIDGGRVLEVRNPGLRYQLGSVFSFIPRTRITQVEQVPGSGSIRIEIAQDTAVDSFQLRSGAIVIDVKDAETPTDQRTAATETVRDMPAPGQGALPFFWQDRLAGPSKPLPEALLPAASELAGPDERVQQAEAALLEQIGRAAAQGLIRVDTPQLPQFAQPDDGSNAPAEDAAAAEAAAPRAGDHLALHSETAVDRDARLFDSDGTVSDRGFRCALNSDFDLGAWRGESSPAELIGHARRDLLGEFDRPVPDAVLNLAQSYVSIGFGTEALSVLRSYPDDSEQASSLELIARIMEERPIAPNSTFLAMTDCDAKVALWALMGSTQKLSPSDVQLGAVRRAFTSLPPEVRAIIGPRLVDKLIEMGAADIAATIRASLARAPGDHEGAVSLVDAHLAQESGDEAAADQHLEGLLTRNSEDAASALIALINGKLDSLKPVDDATIEQAAAMAFELGNTDKGLSLLRAHILGLGSVGRFAPAFEALDRWKPGWDPALRDETLASLFAQIGRVPDDQLLLTTYFEHRNLAQGLDMTRETRIALAERLIGLGFSSAGRDILGPDGRLYERGRLLLAKAALAERDAPAALAYLSTQSGEEADQLRGQALRMLGEHAGALAEFDRAGTADLALDEAWRSGNWQRVLEDGSDQQKTLLTTYGLGAPASEPPAAAADAPPPGPITRASELLAQSEAERKALSDLLSQYPLPPVDPATGTGF